MKKEFKSVSVLTYYNPKKQTIFQTDASVKGLVTVYYEMTGQYIWQVKISLMPRMVYVVIELELLAVAWALKKFHHFYMVVIFH